MSPPGEEAQCTVLAPRLLTARGVEILEEGASRSSGLSEP